MRPVTWSGDNRVAECIVRNNEHDDDNDTAIEVINLFVRSNILKRMFRKC